MMNTRESNNNNNKRMKTKMNKKCTTQNEDETSEEEDEERKEDVNTSKKRGKGSVVMEGSRCSRVNGRGIKSSGWFRPPSVRKALRTISQTRTRDDPLFIFAVVQNGPDPTSLSRISDTPRRSLRGLCGLCGAATIRYSR